MRFTLAQLEAFYWIAKLGTIRDAARHLNLAQPSVSLRLRDLEVALGAPLFERRGRAVRLTHEGLVLLEDATPLLAAARQIQERAGTHDAVRGTIRLGVPETFAVVCLPDLINLLSREHPGLRLELDIATSAPRSGFTAYTLPPRVSTYRPPSKGRRSAPTISSSGSSPVSSNALAITPVARSNAMNRLSFVTA